MSHPARRRRKLRAALGAAEAALAVAGAACLVLYVGACARASWWQLREQSAFERALRARLERESPDQARWSPGRIRKYRESLAREVTAIGRLEIPRTGLSVMVLDGTDDATLDRAVGRIEGTALPGESGNLGIAGHRDGYFRGLAQVEIGDAITLSTLEGVAHYEVVDARIVDPTQVEVLDPTSAPILTLVTCYPFYFTGDAPQRYVVRAEQVSYEPWRSVEPSPFPLLARP